MFKTAVLVTVLSISTTVSAQFLSSQELKDRAVQAQNQFKEIVGPNIPMDYHSCISQANNLERDKQFSDFMKIEFSNRVEYTFISNTHHYKVVCRSAQEDWVRLGTIKEGMTVKKITLDEYRAKLSDIDRQNKALAATVRKHL